MGISDISKLFATVCSAKVVAFVTYNVEAKVAIPLTSNDPTLTESLNVAAPVTDNVFVITVAPLTSKVVQL